jgi:hypothetical protein
MVHGQGEYRAIVEPIAAGQVDAQRWRFPVRSAWQEPCLWSPPARRGTTAATSIGPLIMLAEAVWPLVQKRSEGTSPRS